MRKRFKTIYVEHLIAVARRSALERIPHSLLKTVYPAAADRLADARFYRLPLTQELIGDALGLSVPPLNRMLRQLREDGLSRSTARSSSPDFDIAYLSRFRIGELLGNCIHSPAARPAGSVGIP